MNAQLRNEIKSIIQLMELQYSVNEFPNKIDWNFISSYHPLSEDFIREFKDKVNWYYISEYQRLSEDFIREFKDIINWNSISFYQKLSEIFIREFKDKVNWNSISSYQKLSEDFIREFKDKVNWSYISQYQKLSESFIKEFKNKVNWNRISSHQVLSKKFIEEFKNKLKSSYIKQYQLKEKSYNQKLNEVRKYAKHHKLKFDGYNLYAFRVHDIYGRGVYNKTIFYEAGKYYRDWHCDINPKHSDSYGLGIFSEGNIPVKVAVDDWGVAVAKSKIGKARVWGITVL